MIKYIHRCNNPAVMNIWLGNGYGIEIDVWYHDGKLFSGHDYPEYLIELASLHNEMVLVHAKDIETLAFLHSRCWNKDIHYFFHDKDKATLTNWGLIVYHSSVNLDRKYNSNEIPVLPHYECYGNAFGVVIDVIDAQINQQIVAAQ